MESTGIVRQIDELGKIVIPKELREKMELRQKDSIKFYVEKGRLVLEKYEDGCFFCGDLEQTFEFAGVTICKNCSDKMNEK